jgi:phosphopantothenoylcysteine decarboxylase/phosphopantothenate--cysteine ligase
MDHDMWRHPATQRNVATLRADGVTVVEPAHGALASGLVGDGRMPEPEDLVGVIGEWLARARPDRSLAGRHVLVTAGPTREALDPVRFLSNGSTGTMGFEIARAAARRGARVTLLAGPVALGTPPGVDRVDIVTADDLLREALAVADGAAPPDLVIAAAAVSDYAPAEASDRKLKKTDADLTVTLRRTPDVLAALGDRKAPGQTLVGFALETHDGEASARGKMARKHLDWIVLNSAAEAGAGFGTGTNRATLLAADGRRVEVATAPKRDVAEAILDAVTAPPDVA